MAKSPTKIMFMDDDESSNVPPQVKESLKNVPKASVDVKEPTIAPSGDHRILDLPSKGQFGYPATVEYRDMLAKDEEVLASTTPDTYVRSLNGVVKSVLNNCSWYEQISVNDRDYALIWLWANNYTPRKTLEIKCSNKSCGHTEKHVVDMTTLEVTDVKEGFTGAFQMTLKKTGKPVKVRLNTVSDELEVEALIAKDESGELRKKYDYLMLAASVDVGMRFALDKKAEWVGENLTARELAIVKEFHKRYSFGVKTRLEHTCSECKEVTHFNLPFSATDVLFPNADLGDVEFDIV